MTRAAQFRDMFAIAEDRKIVLKVSWLVPEKGIDTFLQAARLVVASDPRAHFVIVGAGYCFDKYRALSDELGIERNVTWTGALEDPIQEGAFAAAHVLANFPLGKKLLASLLLRQCHAVFPSLPLGRVASRRLCTMVRMGSWFLLMTPTQLANAFSGFSGMIHYGRKWEKSPSQTSSKCSMFVRPLMRT